MLMGGLKLEGMVEGSCEMIIQSKVVLCGEMAKELCPNLFKSLFILSNLHQMLLIFALSNSSHEAAWRRVIIRIVPNSKAKR